ncbi:MAG: T9SS C-terminal target domain-containing protein, partial [Bacteroidetes bacterium]
CVAEINNDNGEITYIPVVENACPTAFHDFSNTPQLTTTLPSGMPQTYTALILDTPPCQSMCQYNSSSMGAMATDVSPIEQELKMAFTATPTLVQEAITFTSGVTITKVQVYDMQGKKVMDTPIENKQLLVSQLKEGIYFVQVHFADKQVRTVKIYKK